MGQHAQGPGRGEQTGTKQCVRYKSVLLYIIVLLRLQGVPALHLDLLFLYIRGHACLLTCALVVIANAPHCMHTKQLQAGGGATKISSAPSPESRKQTGKAAGVTVSMESSAVDICRNAPVPMGEDGGTARHIILEQGTTMTGGKTAGRSSHDSDAPETGKHSHFGTRFANRHAKGEGCCRRCEMTVRVGIRTSRVVTIVVPATGVSSCAQCDIRSQPRAYRIFLPPPDHFKGSSLNVTSFVEEVNHDDPLSAHSHFGHRFAQRHAADHFKGSSLNVTSFVEDVNHDDPLSAHSHFGHRFAKRHAQDHFRVGSNVLT